MYVLFIFNDFWFGILYIWLCFHLYLFKRSHRNFSNHAGISYVDEYRQVRIGHCYLQQFRWFWIFCSPYITHDKKVTVQHETWAGRTLVGNKIVDHADVVRAAPVGPAPTTSSFSAEHLASMDWAEAIARRDEKHFWDFIYLFIYLFIYFLGGGGG